MARPSKLSDRQWAEIGRRLAAGESMRALAKEFKIGVSRISERFSERVPVIRELASSLATVEREIDMLPVTEQVSVRSLADHLKGIANSVAEVAATSAKTGVLLAGLAHKQTKKLVEQVEAGEALQVDAFRGVAALQETANRAVSTGLGLMTAQKGKAGDEGGSLEDLVVASRVGA